jgi:hypothetical protein
MVSEADRNAIDDAGLSYILGAKIREVPYLVAQWRRKHPGEQVPTGRSSPSPGRPPTSNESRAGGTR